eukprot:Skav214991  [mRNA]  locus=scaffold508:451724:454658:+ [translate_table: standard]
MWLRRLNVFFSEDFPILTKEQLVDFDFDTMSLVMGLCEQPKFVKILRKLKSGMAMIKHLQNLLVKSETQTQTDHQKNEADKNEAQPVDVGQTAGHEERVPPESRTAEENKSADDEAEKTGNDDAQKTGDDDAEKASGDDLALAFLQSEGKAVLQELQHLVDFASEDGAAAQKETDDVGLNDVAPGEIDGKENESVPNKSASSIPQQTPENTKPDTLLDGEQSPSAVPPTPPSPDSPLRIDGEMQSAALKGLEPDPSLDLPPLPPSPDSDDDSTFPMFPKASFPQLTGPEPEVEDLPAPVMEDVRTLYEMLEVDSRIKESELRKAYLTKSKKVHPDKQGGSSDSTLEFQKLNYAYEVLSNPAKKFEYDLALAKGISGSHFQFQATPSTAVSPKGKSRGKGKAKAKAAGRPKATATPSPRPKASPKSKAKAKASAKKSATSPRSPKTTKRTTKPKSPKTPKTPKTPTDKGTSKRKAKTPPVKCHPVSKEAKEKFFENVEGSKTKRTKK